MFAALTQTPDACKDCVMGAKHRPGVLKKDCEFICDALPTIFVLPNHKTSLGSVMEVALGRALGLDRKFLRNRRRRLTNRS
jgi:hypothetical protein